jgi:putative transposase
VDELIAKAAYPPPAKTTNLITRWKGYALGKTGQINVAGPQQNAADVLTEILQAGSHELLAAALEVEIEEFLAKFADEKEQRGRGRIVRNGFHRPREVQTGIGSIQVKAPRARDPEPSHGPIKFTSAILPRYLRRSKSIEGLLP